MRVASIGRSSRGGYGHCLERAFEGVDGARVVALSNRDPAGRAVAQIVYGREIGDHLELALAATKKGARIYFEKPAAVSPHAADQRMAACALRSARSARLGWRTSHRARRAGRSCAGLRVG